MEDMYSMIKTNRREKIFKEKYLAIKILIAVAVIGSVCIGIGLSARLQIQFRRYISDLSNSTTYAYKNEKLLVGEGERSYIVTGEDIYKFYRYAIVAKVGEPVGELPQMEPDMVLNYGDGSVVKLWKKTFTEGRDNISGSIISYTNQKGKEYNYQLPRIDVKSLQYAYLSYK